MKSNLSARNSQTSLARLCCAALAGLGVVLPALGAAPSRSNPLDCVLEPYEVVEVSSAVQGVINQIHVARNDMVGKGQLLVELDSGVERTQVELARAKATLKTDIELRETELAFNERNQQRLEKLYKSDTVSLHLKDEAETDTEKSRLQLRSARDNKRLAELELAEAEAMLALRSLHSPISGVVVARNKVAGEYVEDQSILRLAQLDPLKVEVIAPVELFGSITEGMRVEVVPEHLGQEPVFATVTMVDRVIDPASGTFDVRAELPNPDLAIPSGLRCTVEFLHTPYPSAVIAAVAETQAGSETGSEPGLETSPEPLAAAATPAPEPLVERALESPLNPDPDPDSDPEVAAPAEKTTDLAASTAAPAQSPVALEARAQLCPAPGPVEKARYFVLVDPGSHALPATQLLEKMRAEGVHDLFVMARGDNRGKVSVGIYSQRRNAEKRREEMSELGFLAYLETQTRKVPAPDCDMEDQVAAHDL